ncbi:ATP-dependent RNA helicase [Sorochytrium milnesiophthora]
MSTHQEQQSMDDEIVNELSHIPQPKDGNALSPLKVDTGGAQRQEIEEVHHQDRLRPEKSTQQQLHHDQITTAKSPSVLEPGSAGHEVKRSTFRTSVVHPHQLPRRTAKHSAQHSSWWTYMSRACTLCFPAILLRSVGKMPDSTVQQAWREKMTLCIIITVCCGMLTYLTVGLTRSICGSDSQKTYIAQSLQRFYPAWTGSNHAFIVRGEIYDLTSYLSTHLASHSFSALSAADQWRFQALNNVDLSMLFPPDVSKCAQVAQTSLNMTCFSPWFPALAYCHTTAKAATVLDSLKLGSLRVDWSTLSTSTTHIVYSGQVIDVSAYLTYNPNFLGPTVKQIVSTHIGKDASLALARTIGTQAAADCLASLYTVGYIDDSTPGCMASNVILYISLIIILGVVMTRFFLAIAFDWFLSWKLGKLQEERRAFHALRKSKSMMGFSRRNTEVMSRSVSQILRLPSQPRSGQMSRSGSQAAALGSTNSLGPLGRSSSALGLGQSSSALVFDEQTASSHAPSITAVDSTVAANAAAAGVDVPDELRQYYTIMLITCYSESEQSVKVTLDSLAGTDYPTRYKLLFVIADGIITGAGNDKSTPDIILDMIDLDPSVNVEPQSYISIANGSKRHNKAKVYAGWYACGDQRVPIILIVKCGTEAEKVKPGNRGKRDSQIILMDFFAKLMFDGRLSPLQYDMCDKIYNLTGVSPERFEIVLMVDADTKVMPDSLGRMVACMARDQAVMGLCGETRIENKTDSWVTRIQVFEYYISHHLGKAFESIFGGVTCLPGCFCMYRIKARKGEGFWVPILCSPAIVNEYSENVVETLHKKNLLLLGEDRFLSTLMLRTFPKRKMMFVPKALCRTTVPDKLDVLLSQRRRWINSTIHNLMELVLVSELCGTFCFSMQFVVFLELFGTVTLPAAIVLTLYLLISTAFGAVQVIPLVLLFCILGLPAVLILFTTRKMIYIYWMLIYLLALPVWNFLLPVYAFWHFDDFSWGQTRKVDGETGKDDHGKKEGEFCADEITLKRLGEWERDALYARNPERAKALEHQLNTPIGSVRGGQTLRRVTLKKKKTIKRAAAQ